MSAEQKQTVVDFIGDLLERQTGVFNGNTIKKDAALSFALESLTPESLAQMREVFDLIKNNKLGPMEFGFSLTEMLRRGINTLKDDAKNGDLYSQEMLKQLQQQTLQNPRQITPEQFLDLYSEIGEKLFAGNYVRQDLEWATRQAERYNEAIFVRLNGIFVENPFEVSRANSAANNVNANEEPIGNRVQSAESISRNNSVQKK